jgi:ATP-dependent RNA helicase DDX35
VAATTVAARVAEEMGCNLGEEVGYSIRFEDVTSPKTRIKYMTDGMLLREALMDPLLRRYSVIMLDEAHERGLYTDILMGLLKKYNLYLCISWCRIRRKRPDLRIIISSATIDAAMFKEFFSSKENQGGDQKTPETVTAISLEGRTFPVDVMYMDEPSEDYIESALKTVMDIHLKVILFSWQHWLQEPEGDILLFLTGRDEIERCVAELASRLGQLNPSTPKLNVLPLYAGLPSSEQLAVFQPAEEGERKVIVATNVAEASVTIDGIVYVIDCGFVKVLIFPSAIVMYVDACIQPENGNRVSPHRSHIPSLCTPESWSSRPYEGRKMLSSLP